MLINHMFEESCKRFGKKIAIIDKATQKEYTYSKILIASLILMQKLKNIRTKNIGIMIPTSAGCIISFIATTFANKVPVMINYSQEAINSSLYAQEKCNFKVILTSRALLEKLDLKPIDGMIFLEDILLKVTLWDKLKALLKSKLPSFLLKKMISTPNENDNLLVLFTSGSEKEPKGVILSHKNITHQLINIPKIFSLDDKDIFMANLPLFHVFGITVTFLLPFYIGCTIVSHANPLDYQGISKSVKEHKITFLVGTPTFFSGYLKKSKKGTFNSVKVAVVGADKLPKKLRQEYKKIHNLEVLEGYGVTESSPVISVNTLSEKKHGSIGKPIPNQKVRIVDIDSEEILPPDKIGKIQVKGENVMSGYYGDIEETAMRIHQGWYDTGDIGCLDEDGFLWHKGRLKRFIKIAGEMVSLPAVEEALSEYFEEDVYYCAVELPDNKKGAMVALAATKAINPKEIKNYLSKKIASIAIPKKYFYLDELPLSGSGKVDFRKVNQICKEMDGKKV